MIRISLFQFTTMLLILMPQLATAEIYKWVDEQGRSHFSDRAPDAVQAEQITVKINTYSNPSYSTNVLTADPSEKALKRSSRKVTLYSTTWCGVCKKAKAYFREKHISYTEYDVETSAKGKADYRKLNGQGVPIILVGDRRLNGFNQQLFENLYRQ